MPRTGTSILRQFLKRFNHICVFGELLPANVCPTPRLFFDLQKLKKYIAPGSTNETMYKKLSDATKDEVKYVGLKSPEGFAHFEEMKRVFAHHKVVYLHPYRALNQVALSYERRARNPADKWPSSRNWVAAVSDAEAYLSSTITDLDRSNKLHRHIFISYSDIGNFEFWSDVLCNELCISHKQLERVKPKLSSIWRPIVQTGAEQYFSKSLFLETIGNTEIEKLLSRLSASQQIVIPIWQ